MLGNAPDDTAFFGQGRLDASIGRGTFAVQIVECRLYALKSRTLSRKFHAFQNQGP